MRRCVLILVCCLIPTSLFAGDIALIENKKVSDKLLIQILNNGVITKLNEISLAKNVEQSLYLRLISIPFVGNCNPKTEAICSHRYFLAASEWGEYPKQTAYDLGIVGEITKIEWIGKNKPDHAYLRVTVSDFPPDVIKDVGLVGRTRAYTLDVSMESLKIKKEK